MYDCSGSQKYLKDCTSKQVYKLKTYLWIWKNVKCADKIWYIDIHIAYELKTSYPVMNKLLKSVLKKSEFKECGQVLKKQLILII